MKKLISIIVPVYKVEEYLEKCLDGLINQTYKNIEIILVNDGSPDNSPQICDDYSKRDNRIKVIHKKNGGLSEARNTGLNQAQGEYVLFVDSDDYIDLDTCQRFFNQLAFNHIQPEIIVGNARRTEGEKTFPMSHQYNTKGICVTGKEYLKKELVSNTMYMAAVLNLYKREFLILNNLFFKVGVLHEDEQFTPRVFLKADLVQGTDIVFYNYLIREGSITTQKNNLNNAIHLISICKELDEIYKTIDDLELKALLRNDLVDKYLNIFQVTGLHKKKYSHLIDKEFLKDKALTSRNKKRVMLWNFNKGLYFYTNKLYKQLFPPH